MIKNDIVDDDGELPSSNNNNNNNDNIGSTNNGEYPPPPSYTVAMGVPQSDPPNNPTEQQISSIQLPPTAATQHQLFQQLPLHPPPLSNTIHNNRPIIIENNHQHTVGVTGWCERQQKNKPQSNSVGAGMMMMLISGLHIGWGIYRLSLRGLWFGRPTSIHISTVQIVFVITVFHIGSNVGAGIGASMLRTMSKKKIYYVCGILNLISSLSMMIGYDEIAAIFIGRIFAGFAHGICYFTVIVHASENCVKEIRGMLISSINFCVLTSIFTLTALDSIPHGRDITSSIDFWVGLLSLIYTISAMIFVPFLTYESVVRLLVNGDDDYAIKTMIKLRNESIETWDIRHDYEDIKAMIVEDKQMENNSCFLFKRGFLLCITTQILTGISTCIAVNIIQLYIINTLVGSNYGMLLLLPRLLAALVPMFFSDWIGRRPLILFSSVFGGLSMFVLGILLAAAVMPVWILSIFVFLFQFCIGLGSNAIPDVILSEAFSTTQKISSIRVLIIIEQIIHIIMIAISINVVITDAFFSAISLVFGILMIAIGGLLTFYLPETKKKTLRQTRDLFKKLR